MLWHLLASFTGSAVFACDCGAMDFGPMIDVPLSKRSSVRVDGRCGLLHPPTSPVCALQNAVSRKEQENGTFSGFVRRCLQTMSRGC